MIMFPMPSRIARPALAALALAVACVAAPMAVAAGYAVTESLSQRSEYNLSGPGVQVSYTAPVGDPANVAHFRVGGMSYDAYTTISSGVSGSVRGRLELLDASGRVFGTSERSVSIGPGAESSLHLQVIANLAGPAASVRVSYESVSGEAIVLKDAMVQRTLTQYTVIGSDFDLDD